MVTKEQILRFKAAIVSKRSELAREIRTQSGAITINEGDHYPIDLVQSINMREGNATILGRRSRLLSELNRSLDAISNGRTAFVSIVKSRSESSGWKSYRGPRDVSTVKTECRDTEDTRAA